MMQMLIEDIPADCVCYWTRHSAHNLELEAEGVVNGDCPVHGMPQRPKRGEHSLLRVVRTGRDEYGDLEPTCQGCGEPLGQCQLDVPEPPDGTRLEFEHYTDVYAMWRCDQSSIVAGWQVGRGEEDAGRVWCLYGETVPRSWVKMRRDFGDCVLALAVRLVPMPEDLPKRELWPTQQRLARGGRTDV